MKRVTFKILFVAKHSRIAKDGKAPVLLRITVNGQRTETTINLKVDPEKWNAIAGKCIGDSGEDDEINLRLDTIRLRIMQIYREMELDRNEITAKTIIDEYQGRNIKPVIMLLDVFREHNERCRY